MEIPTSKPRSGPRKAQEGLQDQVSISEIPTSKPRSGQDRPKKGFKIRSLSQRSQLQSQEVAQEKPKKGFKLRSLSERSQLPSQEVAKIGPRRASRSGLYLRDPNFQAKKWPKEAQEGLQDQVSILEIPTSKPISGQDRPKKGFKIRSLSQRSQLPSQEVAKIGPRKASRSSRFLGGPTFKAKKWPR